jgi:hypothetical protein
MKLPNIDVDFQVFLADGEQAIGTVRRVTPRGRPELDIYVENAGDFVVPLSAVTGVHASKVIVDVKKLDERLRLAMGHSHDAEARDGTIDADRRA